METIDARELVGRAIKAPFQEFAQRHPNLARQLDEQMLIERTLDDLYESNAFRNAMGQVQAGTMSADVLTDIIVGAARLVMTAMAL